MRAEQQAGLREAITRGDVGGAQALDGEHAFLRSRLGFAAMVVAATLYVLLGSGIQGSPPPSTHEIDEVESGLLMWWRDCVSIA